MKLALFDIDEVLITAKRKGRVDHSLAYYERLKLWEPILHDKYGERAKGINLSVKDSLDLKETTDLGTLCLGITPMHFPERSYYDLDRKESATVQRNAYEVIQSSIKYYFRLLEFRKSDRLFGRKDSPFYIEEVKIKEGINDLLNRLTFGNWNLHIASGNPTEIAGDKLKKAHLFSMFTANAEYPWLTPAPVKDHNVILDGADYVTRDRMTKDYFDHYKPETAIYFGDRLSDIGLVERLHKQYPYFRGVIFPSFNHSHLKNHRITSLIHQGIIMIVNDLPSQLESGH